MDHNDLQALRLLAEAQRHTDLNQPAAARITIRSANGEYLGDIVLPAAGLERATQAVSAVADYKERRPADFTPAPAPDLDPHLIADIEDHFADIDPDSYLADVFGGPDAEASLTAFEQLVTGEWDGQL